MKFKYRTVQFVELVEWQFFDVISTLNTDSL